MLYLLEFIKSHDNWEELLARDPYNLKISRDNGYIMFKYNQLSSDFNLPLVQEARGIIFKEDDWTCVCHPFNKFGNYGESYCPEINWDNCSVQEKVDGSLMKVWYNKGWNISTNGLIDAFKAPLECADAELDSYGKLFLYCLNCMRINEHDFFGELDTNYCYMFEMVSPYNRVVIEYKEPKLYYLGCRYLVTDQEYSPEERPLMIAPSKRYNLHTLEDVKNAANALPWDEEGYVVCDNKFDRVKIKSPEYVLAHKGRTNGNISTLRLIDTVLQNEVDEFLIYCSEYTDKINSIIAGMEIFKTKIKLELVNLAPMNYSSRKEYAEKVKTYPSHWQMFLFRYDKIEETFAKLVPSQWKRILELEERI